MPAGLLQRGANGPVGSPHRARWLAAAGCQRARWQPPACPMACGSGLPTGPSACGRGCQRARWPAAGGCQRARWPTATCPLGLSAWHEQTPTSRQSGWLRAMCWPWQAIQHANPFTQRARGLVNGTSMSLVPLPKAANRNTCVACHCSTLSHSLGAIRSFHPIAQ